MFCNQCGSRIPEQSEFCPECGCKVRKQTESTGLGQNNIFMGITHERSRGSYLEFVIWILVCLSGVLALLSEVLMQDNVGIAGTTIFANFRVLWLFVFILSAGIGVSMALRLRVLTVYAGSIAFFFLLLISYFICESRMAKLCIYYMGDGSTGIPVFMKGIFLLAILVAVGLVAVCSVQVFTKYRLGKITAILSICAMVFTLFLGIVSYAAPYMQIKSYQTQNYEEYYNGEEVVSLEEKLSGYYNSYRQRYVAVKNGFGTLAYLLICLAATLYTVFFFVGLIDNRRQKFVKVSPRIMDISFEEGQQTGDMAQNTLQNSRVPLKQDMSELPMLRGIKGSYSGQFFPAQEELIIGSQPSYAHIIIEDAAISPQHCSIRYNSSNNCYEVRDLSEKGTYIGNGQRLQHGVYTTCSRGTVIYLGSDRQQFLMQ